jgi:hypothetical protein
MTMSSCELPQSRLRWGMKGVGARPRTGRQLPQAALWQSSVQPLAQEMTRSSSGSNRSRNLSRNRVTRFFS